MQRVNPGRFAASIRRVRPTKSLLQAIIALAIIAGMPGLAHNASAAVIVNGDFTADNWPAGTLVPTAPNSLTSITGWTLLPGATIVGIGTGFASIPTPAVELTGWNDNVPGSGISQTLGTTAGNAYTLSFDIYDIGSLISRVNFSLNGNQLGTNLNAQGGSIVGGTTKGQTYTYNFTSIGSDVISFAWAGRAVPGNQVSILADVQVTTGAPVPEPGTWAAAALLAGTALLARRHRRAAKARVHS